MIYFTYLVFALILAALIRQSAFWLTLAVVVVLGHTQPGCATLDRDIGTTALIAAKAAPLIVDALDVADSAVKLSCRAEPASESACRAAWIAKREDAAKGLASLLDSIYTTARARNGGGSKPRKSPRKSHRPKSERRKLPLSHRKFQRREERAERRDQHGSMRDAIRDSELRRGGAL